MSEFHLFETMRLDPEGAIPRLRLHLARLERSAGRLGFPGAKLARAALDAHLGLAVFDPAVDGCGTGETRPRGGPRRLRLALEPTGTLSVTAAPFVPLAEDAIWTVRIASTRLSSADRLLRHKTSRREIYERARAECTAGEADEMLLLNERGEPCEGTITSIFLDDGSGVLKTPPICNGLLAGVLRTELICARRARVERFGIDAIRAGRFFIGNSLRGLIPARLVE